MADSDCETGGHNNSNAGRNSEGSSQKEQDRYLPIANVSRIMKKALPANAKISKDAKETVQECVSEFISFITGEGSNKCQREKRKTINGDDLLWAMTTLGFEEYVDPLKVYLQKFREMEGEKGGSSFTQSQQDGGNMGNNGGGTLNMGNNGIYGGAMIMGQKMYGSPSPSPAYHHQQIMYGGAGAKSGMVTGNPIGNSSSPTGIGRQR